MSIEFQTLMVEETRERTDGNLCGLGQQVSPLKKENLAKLPGGWKGTGPLLRPFDHTDTTANQSDSSQITAWGCTRGFLTIMPLAPKQNIVGDFESIFPYLAQLLGWYLQMVWGHVWTALMVWLNFIWQQTDRAACRPRTAVGWKLLELWNE